MTDESMNLLFSFCSKQNHDINVYYNDETECTYVLNKNEFGESYRIPYWDDVYGEFVKLFEQVKYFYAVDKDTYELLDIIEATGEYELDYDAMRELMKEVD